jgi:hypothetical protein
MVIEIFNPASENSINHRFRSKRFKFFLSLLEKVRSDKPIHILDIGGTEMYWERMKFVDATNVCVTLLNVEEVKTQKHNFISIKGDATDLSSFRDKEFEIVFSNSVIEHLFSVKNQIKMAREIMRVGKNYYVQTPNLYFPIEPHWLFPCFQFLPFKVRVFLTRNLDLGHYKKAVNEDEAIKRVNEVKLLTERKMRKVFPDGKVYREKFLGMVKSVTMYRFPEEC